MAEEVILAFTGDVMLGRGVNEAIRASGPGYPWGDTLELLKQADLRLINLECVIAAGGEPWQRSPKTFFFRADPPAIETLKLAGIDFVSLANNHSLDFQEEALIETIKRLDDAGIARAGAGRNLEEAARPGRLETRGLKIAVMAITDNEPDWEATVASPGTHYMPITTETRAFAELCDRIRHVKAESDMVVMTAHWGPNMVERPPRLFRRFARAVVNAGVDIFHGHSAHIFQGIEIYKNGLIMYDTGDFVDDYMVDPLLRNDLSFLFLVTIHDKAVVELRLIPTLISDFQVNKAVGREADWALSRVAGFCDELGTVAIRLEGGLLIPMDQSALKKTA